MSAAHPSTRVARIMSVLAVGALAVSACGGDDDDASATTVAVAEAPAAASDASAPAFGLVSPQEALALSTDPAVTVIDVRTPEEFSEGHIDGAVMIDFYADTFADEITALDPDGTYLLYCRSGNRSGQTATLMQQAGFGQLYDMQGGIVAYTGQGLPLVS